jgi:hypothetical protein
MYLRGRGGARSSGRRAGGPAEEGFYEDLARQNIVARLFQRQLDFQRRHTWVSVWSHMGFCRSDWLANPIACTSFPRLTLPLCR